MSTRKKTALAVAHALREEYRQRGEFRQSEYRDALALRLEEFRADSFEGFVDGIAKQVDDQVTREPDDGPEQQTLWDLGGEYRLGDGRRIAKALARLPHADEMLAILDRNLSEVMQSSARKHAEVAKLRKYWGPDMNKRQAIAAYEADKL